MDCPSNLNAIDEPMAEELLTLLARCEEDPAVRTIVICGAGRAFSSGGAVGFFYDMVRKGTVDMSRLARLVGQLALAIKGSGKIIITAVNGVAAGAGANLALNGDFVFCSKDAKFIQAFAGLGLAPDTGGAYLLSRGIGWQRAMEYCVLDKPMSAVQAKALGLVYQLCPQTTLMDEVTSFAARIAAGPTTAYRGVKEQMFDAAFSGYAQFLTGTEGPIQNACAATEDFREGVCAFMEKRRPMFCGQ